MEANDDVEPEEHLEVGDEDGNGKKE